MKKETVMLRCDPGICMQGLRKAVKNAGRMVGLRGEIRAQDLLHNAKHSTAMFGKTKKEKRNISKQERRTSERQQFVVGLSAIVILEFVSVGQEMVVENIRFENI
jgi:hypothetical protein